jgi:McbB family protein
MIAVIKALQSYSGPIAQSALHTLLENHDIKGDLGQAFLERLGVIQPRRTDIAVAVYSKDKESVDLLLAHIRANDSVEASATDDPLNILEPTLFVVIQSAYCPHFSLEITDICRKNKNLLLLNAYFIFRHFIIDGLFSYEMGLPDHFSVIDRFIFLDRSPHFKPASWSELFYADSTTQLTSVPTLPVAPLEKIGALYTLYTRLRPLISYGTPPFFPNDMSTIFELNLDTGVLQKHVGAHSPHSLSSRMSGISQCPEGSLDERTWAAL